MGASKHNNLNKVKVLMLHGHNQSGLFFRYKTGYLEKILKKRLQSSSAFSDQLAVEFEYPSGPLHADPDCPLEGSSDRWAWGHGDHQTDRIKGIENSIRYILQYLHEKGPFIGIMGFSSGAALAAIVTSLLERRNTITGMDLQINHPSLSFLVCFSGFKLNHAFYKTVYREKIQTPTLIVIGEVDTMIFPSETLQLMQQCENAQAFLFWGAHQIPRNSVNFPSFWGEFVQSSLQGKKKLDKDDKSVWVDEYFPYFCFKYNSFRS